MAQLSVCAWGHSFGCWLCFSNVAFAGAGIFTLFFTHMPDVLAKRDYGASLPFPLHKLSPRGWFELPDSMAISKS